MIRVFKLNWKLYLIEAWALGMFMISAILFTMLFEHPSFYFKTAISSSLERRFFIGLAMGGTAVFLIYSGWGKKSGAHMNPAVTLTFLLLKRISRADAFFYIVAQFIGALWGVLLMLLLFPSFVQDASVNYVVTIPAGNGITAAFIYEFLMSFILIEVILIAGNSTLQDCCTVQYTSGAMEIVKT
jgi:aquaporin Z